MTAPTPGRDLQAEEAGREFDGWFEAQGYPSPEGRYDGEEMAGAFTAGMQAERDLAAAWHSQAGTTVDEPALAAAAEARWLRDALASARAHLVWIWRESADENARQRADQALIALKEAGVE